MALKHLTVHLDHDPGLPARIEIATRLAASHGAHLTGLYLDAHGQRTRAGSYGMASLEVTQFADLKQRLQEIAASQNEERQQAREALIERFRNAAASAGVNMDHRIETVTDSTSAVAHLVNSARTTDIMVLGKTTTNPNMPHDVLFGGGAPVVVVPPSLSAGEIGRSVIIAWNGSAEAGRAVRDALPILEKAEKVTVLCIDGQATGANFRPGDEVAEHLGRHGIKASVIEAPRGRQSVGEAIMARAPDFDTDMLVMGAYGHSRFREFVLGGVTKRVLERAALPVLMSH